MSVIGINFVEVGLLRATFSQNLTPQEPFETTAKKNEELKITKYGGAFLKKLNF